MKRLANQLSFIGGRRARKLSFVISLLACLSAVWILHKLFLFPLENIFIFAGILVALVVILVLVAALVAWLINALRQGFKSSGNNASDDDFE